MGDGNRIGTVFEVLCVALFLLVSGAACGGDDAEETREEGPAFCGDVKVSGDEVCDGSALDNQTCQTLGYASGTLSCRSDCSGFDESSCSGRPNNDACEPQTCAELGAGCGTVDDGCGNSLDCGGCSGDLSCGGSGEANVCGAECRSGCPQGYECSREGICVDGDPTGLVFDVPTADVEVTTTINGENCGSNYDWEIRFTNLRTDEYTFTFCRDSESLVRLPKGRYRIEAAKDAWRGYDGARYLVEADWEVTEDTQLHIDLEISDVAVTVARDGEPLAPNADCSREGLVTVVFENADGYNAARRLHCTGSQTLPIPHGRYRVRVRATGTDDLPEVEYVVDDEWVHDGDSTLDIDIPTAEVAVKVTHNGRTIRANNDCTDGGVSRVTLTNLETGRSGTLSLQCSGSFHRFRIPHGRYEVWAAGYHTDELLPGYPSPALDEWVVDADTDQLQVDIPTSWARLNVTYNGQSLTPNDRCNEFGMTQVRFVDTKTEEFFRINQPCDGSELRVRVPYSRYDIWAAGYHTDDISPSGFHTQVADDWVHDEEQALHVDIRSSQLTVTLTSGTGEGTRRGCTEGAEMILRFLNLDTGSRHSATILCDDEPHSLRLLHGRYRVRIAQRGDQIEHLVAADWEFDADEQLDLEIPYHEVTIGVTHNGEPVEPNGGCDYDGLAVVTLTNLESEDTAELALRCDGSPLTLSLPAGTYRARVGGKFLSDLPDFVGHEAVWKLQVP